MKRLSLYMVTTNLLGQGQLFNRNLNLNPQQSLNSTDHNCHLLTQLVNQIYKAQMSIVMQHVIPLSKILQELEFPENHLIYLLLI
mgnify:CR=1 FL=1